MSSSSFAGDERVQDSIPGRATCQPISIKLFSKLKPSKCAVKLAAEPSAGNCDLKQLSRLTHVGIYSTKPVTFNDRHIGMGNTGWVLLCCVRYAAMTLTMDTVITGAIQYSPMPT